MASEINFTYFLPFSRPDITDPLYTCPMNHLRLARNFADLMDNKFSFWGIHFGWDTIIGFIPGFGDVVSFLLSFYLVWIGYDLGVPSKLKTRMIRNIVIDTMIGTVPILGDIGDVFFKANVRNLRILEEYVANQKSTRVARN